MHIEDTLYGSRVLLRCRGTVGTSQVNLNPLGVALRWSTVFDTAYALDVSSSSAADDGDPAGTGAQIIRIVGLDVNYNRHYEDVVMNGQTKVTTATKFLRVFGLFVKAAGSGKVNAGDIYVVKTGTGGTYTGGVPGTLTSAVLKALIGNNLAFSGLFTVPAHCYYNAEALVATARAQAGTVVVVRGNAAATEFKGPYEAIKLEVSQKSSTPGGGTVSLGPGDDLYVQAFAAAAGGIVNATVQITQTSGPVAIRD